jgi:ribosomal protein L7/L12
MAPTTEMFTIILIDSGDKPFEVIKAVKDISGIGVREAKDIVEDLRSGKV